MFLKVLLVHSKITVFKVIRMFLSTVQYFSSGTFTPCGLWNTLSHHEQRHMVRGSGEQKRDLAGYTLMSNSIVGNKTQHKKLHI